MSFFDALPDAILPDREQTLIKKGSPSARQEIVMGNMREAIIYCRGLRQNGGEFLDDELMSICYRALSLGVENFKPGRSRFFAFCKPRLRGAINRYWGTKDTVRHGKMVTIDAARIDQTPEHRIATKGCPEDDWQEAPELKSQVCEPDFDGIFVRQELGLVDAVMKDKLTEHERMVVNLTFRSGFNFAEIGRLLGVSRVAAKETCKRALVKIRCQLKLRQIGY